jgi:hypothetical protein
VGPRIKLSRSAPGAEGGGPCWCWGVGGRYKPVKCAKGFEDISACSATATKPHSEILFLSRGEIKSDNGSGGFGSEELRHRVVSVISCQDHVLVLCNGLEHFELPQLLLHQALGAKLVRCKGLGFR